MSSFEKWLYPTPQGLYCEPGNFFIDPLSPVDRALITHGHSDHARRGHSNVFATYETIEIMKIRYGVECAKSFEVAELGVTNRIGEIDVRFVPAGHILGSAQIVMEYHHQRVVFSGDYKRSPDPTCLPFELVPCDLFISEATFALPVFSHEPAEREICRLIESLKRYTNRTHLLGVYALGKCQRMIRLLRDQGYDCPIYLHNALAPLISLYEKFGIFLGKCVPMGTSKETDLKGALVLCPPSSLEDRWSRRMGEDPVRVFASGWMRVRGRARQRRVELPLVVSDHADWAELLQTIKEVGADEIWVTHGRQDALIYQLGLMGHRVRGLTLHGYEDEAE
ncbi:MAG: ligase-associated DNA damage response exonuclease [Hyphomicrobium sp.]